jgi:putative DNA primase/helicase
VQPKSADVLELEVLSASDPFTAMALECFEPDAEGSVEKVVAYNVFSTWCHENRRTDVLYKVTNKDFGGRLKAVAGFERIYEGRPHGKRRRWFGMRLKQRDA